MKPFYVLFFIGTCLAPSCLLNQCPVPTTTNGMAKTSRNFDGVTVGSVTVSNTYTECPTPEFELFDGVCFKIVQEFTNTFNAPDICRLHGGRIAHFKTMEQFNRIKKFLPDLYLRHPKYFDRVSMMDCVITDANRTLWWRDSRERADDILDEISKGDVGRTKEKYKTLQRIVVALDRIGRFLPCKNLNCESKPLCIAPNV